MSEGAGEDIHESKEELGEVGAGTGMGDRNQCGGSSDYVRYRSHCSIVIGRKTHQNDSRRNLFNECMESMEMENE